MKSVLYNVVGYITALLFLITVIWFLVTYPFTFEYKVIVTDKQTTYNKQTKDSEYGLINVGECYKFKAFGYRVPLFTMYPNIIDFTQSECKLAKNDTIKSLLEQYKEQQNDDIKNDIIDSLNYSVKTSTDIDKKTIEKIRKLDDKWTVRS
jgi:hypothetical protein